MSHPSLLRPSSHGTEQNTGDPWRKEAAVISYITIPTLFTVQQSLFSVRHGKEVYRSDDMIWLIDLICTVFCSSHPRIHRCKIHVFYYSGAVQILYAFGQQSLSWVFNDWSHHGVRSTSRAACLCVSSAFGWSAQHSFLGFRMSVTAVSTGNKYALVQKKVNKKKSTTESWQTLRNVLTRSVPSWQRDGEER